MTIDQLNAKADAALNERAWRKLLKDLGIETTTRWWCPSCNALGLEPTPTRSGGIYTDPMAECSECGRESDDSDFDAVTVCQFCECEIVQGEQEKHINAACVPDEE